MVMYRMGSTDSSLFLVLDLSFDLRESLPRSVLIGLGGNFRWTVASVVKTCTVCFW